MLVGQAAASFAFWFGTEPPLAEMLAGFFAPDLSAAATAVISASRAMDGIVCISPAR